jgi:prepilin-type processing-associated H-X9-DG protein
MKRNASQRPPNGFTLVELLVVITIIITLAALGFTMVTKMRKNADAAKQTSILHEIGPLLILFSTENNGQIPAAVHKQEREDGGFNHNHWAQYLVGLMRPEVPLSTIKTKEWWDSNKPFLINPLWKQPSNGRTPSHWAPGYALNGGVVNNLGPQKAPWPSHATWYGNVPFRLAAVESPARVPIIAPGDDYHYTTIKADSKAIKQFTVNGKFPVLFVDGHVENVSPREYEANRLHLMPR